MIRIKKIRSKGLYVFQGKSSANSLFIEDLKEAKEFLILANYYFRGYLKIYEYLLSKDGWIMIVRINSLDKLKSNKDGISPSEDEVWRIISERVRIFLSRFVKFTNKKQGRTGSKVHSNYERYLFNSISEAKQYIKLLRNRLIKLHQTKKKYRGKKSHYKVPKKLGLGSIFISSKGKKKLFAKNVFSLNHQLFKVFKKDVPLKLINFTLKRHNLKKNPFSPLE